MKDLNNIINQLNNLNDISRMFHTTKECKFFTSVHGTFTKIDYIHD